MGDRDTIICWRWPYGVVFSGRFATLNPHISSCGYRFDNNQAGMAGLQILRRLQTYKYKTPIFTREASRTPAVRQTFVYIMKTQPQMGVCFDMKTNMVINLINSRYTHMKVSFLNYHFRWSFDPFPFYQDTNGIIAFLRRACNLDSRNGIWWQTSHSTVLDCLLKSDR